MENENNILNNLAPFYIGQGVVYITGYNMPKDSTHIVSNIWQELCGCFSIQINNVDEPFIITPTNATHIRCITCNKLNSITAKERKSWCASSFRPLQQQKFPLIELTKVIEKEKELFSAN